MPYTPVICSILVASLATFAAAAEDASSRWDFEDQATDWRPRAPTVTVERMPGPGATPESRGQLRIEGPIAVGWNYAMSGSQAMAAGAFYRLEAQLRVLHLGPGTPPPFLKCEFIAADGHTSLGRASTTSYDITDMGAWQHLHGSFQAPPGTGSFWLALEKGGEGPMAIDARLDDVALTRIQEADMFAEFALNPLPAALASVQGTHPRLYLTPDRIRELRQAITSTHADLWREVLALAENAVRRGPSAYRENDGWSGEEQLWQREVGNTMPYLALAAVLTEDPRFLDAAREWALASCAYPTWGLGRIDGMDLSTGHQLFGLALIYDWCYDGLGEETRQRLRETFELRAGAMFRAAANGTAWWGKSHLQNHLWVNVCGLSAVGFALYGELGQAEFWIGLPLVKFRTTMAALGSDGASHEGVGYWQYGVEYMLKFMMLARQLLGEDLFVGEWWPNTAGYCQYLMLPRHAWSRTNCNVDLADCPRGNWYGPDTLLRGLATVFTDGRAQWLAEQVDSAGIDAPGAKWLNLFWYDANLTPVPPTDLPTLKHFSDMGIVSARTDWSGDEALLVFKCGPFIGHDALQAFDYDPGGGHVHPDANHFVLFANGEWLIRDDGYCAKWTAQHNTLLVDGQGQMGEGAQWFRGSIPLSVKARPRILRAESTDDLDTIVADAAEAYAKKAGVERFTRHLLFVKPAALIVVDDIVLKAPRDLELRFHPGPQEGEEQGAAFICRTEKGTTLRIEPLTRDGVSTSAAIVVAQGNHGNDLHLYTVAMHKKTAMWQNATAFSWAPDGEQPQAVILAEDGDSMRFTVGDRTVGVTP